MDNNPQNINPNPTPSATPGPEPTPNPAPVAPGPIPPVPPVAPAPTPVPPANPAPVPSADSAPVSPTPVPPVNPTPTPVNPAPVAPMAAEAAAPVSEQTSALPSNPTPVNPLGAAEQPAAAPAQPVPPAPGTPFGPAPVAPPAQPFAPAQPNKKFHIALIAGLATVAVALIITLIIVLVNNNAPKSVSNNNHYEEPTNTGGSGNVTTGADNDSKTISCGGYTYTKLSGYTYDCRDYVLTASTGNYALAVFTGDGIYADYRRNPAAAAQIFAESYTVNRYTIWTADNGTEMVVFDLTVQGMTVYGFVAKASATEIFVGAVANSTGAATFSDLNTAANLLSGSDSTVSRLPEDLDNDTTGDGSMDALREFVGLGLDSVL